MGHRTGIGFPAITALKIVIGLVVLVTIVAAVLGFAGFQVVEDIIGGQNVSDDTQRCENETNREDCVYGEGGALPGGGSGGSGGSGGGGSGGSGGSGGGEGSGSSPDAGWIEVWDQPDYETYPEARVDGEWTHRFEASDFGEDNVINLEDDVETQCVQNAEGGEASGWGGCINSFRMEAGCTAEFAVYGNSWEYSAIFDSDISDLSNVDGPVERHGARHSETGCLPGQGYSSCTWQIRMTCDGEVTTGPLGRSWGLTVVEATVRENTDSDLTTASDPKAEVTAGGETQSTSKCGDCIPNPTWDEELFVKSGEVFTSLDVHMVDYDHATSNDDMGQCSFTVAASNFENAGGESFTVSKSCDPFDITFEFNPR